MKGILAMGRRCQGSLGRAGAGGGATALQAERTAGTQVAGTAGLRATAGPSVERAGSCGGSPRETRQLSPEGPEGHRAFPRERDTVQALSGVAAYVGENRAQGKLAGEPRPLRGHLPGLRTASCEPLPANRFQRACLEPGPARGPEQQPFASDRPRWDVGPSAVTSLPSLPPRSQIHFLDLRVAPCSLRRLHYNLVPSPSHPPQPGCLGTNHPASRRE